MLLPRPPKRPNRPQGTSRTSPKPMPRALSTFFLVGCLSFAPGCGYSSHSQTSSLDATLEDNGGSFAPFVSDTEPINARKAVASIDAGGTLSLIEPTPAQPRQIHHRLGSGGARKHRSEEGLEGSLLSTGLSRGPKPAAPSTGSGSTSKAADDDSNNNNNNSNNKKDNDGKAGKGRESDGDKQENKQDSKDGKGSSSSSSSSSRSSSSSSTSKNTEGASPIQQQEEDKKKESSLQCVTTAEPVSRQNGVQRRDEFQISGPAVSSFMDDFGISQTPDCQTTSRELSLSVTRFPNVSDVVNRSWLAIRINAGINIMAGETRYICASKVGLASAKSCLAKVEWKQSRIVGPALLLVPFLTTNNKKTTTKKHEHEHEAATATSSSSSSSSSSQAASAGGSSNNDNDNSDNNNYDDDFPNDQADEHGESSDEDDLDEAAEALSEAEQERSRWLREYLRQVSNQYDAVLVFLEWACLFSSLVFVASCIHALYLLFTLPDPKEKKVLRGLGTSSCAQVLFNTALRGSSFVLGLDSMATAAMNIALADAPSFVIHGIFGSRMALASIGLLRLAQLLYAGQLYDVGLLQGKCVTPDDKAITWSVSGQNVVVASMDIATALALLIFAGFVGWGLSWSQAREPEIAQSFVSCWGSFSILMQMLMTNVLRHMLQDDGLCNAKIKELASEPVKEGDTTLLHHIQKHPKVDIALNQLCCACRHGRDPLNEIDIGGKDPAEFERGRSFDIFDVGWHAHYIYKKTGSKASVFSLPLCVGLATLAVFQCLVQRYTYVFAMPTLQTFSPSKGLMVPDFSPGINEYTILYSYDTQSISILNLADSMMARKKEFEFEDSTKVEKEMQDPMMSMSLHSQGPKYPHQLIASVEGGAATRNSYHAVQSYNFAMTRVITVFTTLMVYSGGQSQCYFANSARNRHIPLPAHGTDVRVEISSQPHVEGTPVPFQQYKELREHPNSTLTKKPIGVFLQLSDATAVRCRRECKRRVNCLLFHLYTGGCYFIMLHMSPSTCRAAHSAASRAVVGQESASALDRAVAQSEQNLHVALRLCKGQTWQCGEAAFASVEGKIRGRGRIFTLDTLPLEDQHHNALSYSLVARSRDTSSPPVSVCTRTLHFWRSAPPPTDILVAHEKGFQFVKQWSSDDSLIVKIGRYPLNERSGPIRVLLMTATEPEYRAQLSGDAWNPNTTDLNFDLESACRQGRHDFESALELMWACSRRKRSKPAQEEDIRDAVVLELDPFVRQHKFVGQVVPISKNSKVKPLIFTITFETVEPPSVWSIQESCSFKAPHLGTEEVYEACCLETLSAALSCNKIELASREGTVSFTPQAFFVWSLRNAWTPSHHIRILDLFLEAAPKLLVESVEADWEGVKPTTKETCTRHFKRRWDTFKVGWDTFFQFSRKLVEYVCEVSHGKISPRFIAQAIKKIKDENDRQRILRRIRCSEMPEPPMSGMVIPRIGSSPDSPDSPPEGSEESSKILNFISKIGHSFHVEPGALDAMRDWAIAETSPLAASVSANEPDILAALLDQYMGVDTQISVPQSDPTKQCSYFGLLEFVIIGRCRTCIPIVLSAIRTMAKRCAGAVEGTPLAERCTEFDNQHTWLDAGAKDLGQLVDRDVIVSFTAEFAKEVHFRRLELRQALPSNDRLTGLSKLWKLLPSLEILDLAQNSLSTCPGDGKKAPCFWTNKFDVKGKASDDDSKDVYQSVDEAKAACIEMGKVVCNQISCNREHQCQIYGDFELADGNYTGFITYIPSDGCHEVKLFHFLDRLPKLKHLWLHHNKLCDEGLAQIANALQESVESLDVSETGIQGRDVSALSQLSQKLQAVRSLNVSDNAIGLRGLTVLLPGTTKATQTLQTLHINAIGLQFEREGDFKILAKQLAAYRQIRHFVVSDNRLGRGILELAEALIAWESLEILDLGGCGLDGPMLVELAEGWRPKHLKSLRLDNNDLSQDGAEVVIQLLAENEALQTLELRNTSFTDRSAKIFQQNVLEQSWYLREIDLSYNRIGIQRVSSFLNDTAKHLKKLQKLHLGWQLCHEEAQQEELDRLLDSFANAAGHLKELGLSGYKFKLSHLSREFDEARNLPLEKLHLIGSIDPNWDDTDFLRAFPNLQVLDVSNNNFTRRALRGLLTWTRQLPDLEDLSIGGSKFFKQDWDRSREGFHSLRTLRGSFEVCDVELLRSFLPRARILTVES